MKDALNKLKPLLTEMQGIFSSDADVHRYTRRLGDICREFLAIDDIHIKSLSSAKNIDLVISQIMTRCPESLKGRVSTVLNNIKAFSGKDGETQLALQELLIRVWSLKNCYANGVDLIFDNLSHNIETGGGCLPGIAARSVQPYTAFLFRTLENKYEYDDDIDLTMARILNNVQNSNADELEKEEIKLAQLLSLSSDETPSSASTLNRQGLMLFSMHKSEQEQLEWALKESTLEPGEDQINKDFELALQLQFS